MLVLKLFLLQFLSICRGSTLIQPTSRDAATILGQNEHASFVRAPHILLHRALNADHLLFQCLSNPWARSAARIRGTTPSFFSPANLKLMPLHLDRWQYTFLGQDPNTLKKPLPNSESYLWHQFFGPRCGFITTCYVPVYLLAKQNPENRTRGMPNAQRINPSKSTASVQGNALWNLTASLKCQVFSRYPEGKYGIDFAAGYLNAVSRIDIVVMVLISIDIAFELLTRSRLHDTICDIEGSILEPHVYVKASI
ncbi:hypothetical protein IW262DRAFT_1302768 [Armillaria fumosa]|nr:hypothetical protein IW262DRAFT_1302768 [Armillaria fumosa]